MMVLFGIQFKLKGSIGLVVVFSQFKTSSHTTYKTVSHAGGDRAKGSLKLIEGKVFDTHHSALCLLTGNGTTDLLTLACNEGRGGARNITIVFQKQAFSLVRAQHR